MFCDVISPKLEELSAPNFASGMPFMVKMTLAKFHFKRLMLTLPFGIRASEPLGPGKRLERLGLIGLGRSSNIGFLIN